MGRTLSGSVITELTAATVRPILLYEATFAGQLLRLWSGQGDLSWDSKTWQGNGWIQSVSGGAETSETIANGVVVTMSGIPAAVLSSIFLSKHTDTGKVWLGFLNSSRAVIADPVLLFSGFLDVPEVQESSENTTVAISYENELVELRRPRGGRWNDESQKALYPDDLGFQHVEKLANWQGFWGLPTAGRRV